MKKHKILMSTWKISTAVLSILLVASVLTGGFVKIKSTASTRQAVADKAVKFINENFLQGQGTAVLKSVEESNGLYKIILNVGGQEIESYISSDEKLLFPQVISLEEVPSVQKQTQQVQTQNIEKSGKPVVELFVMSHCPYGTQIEKGIIPVVKELGDKIDFELKFVNYAMHGKKELDEQLRQYCIQRDFNNKYTTYLSKFLETENPNEALSAIGLSEADISQCVGETDNTYKVTELYEDPQKTEWSGRFPPFKVYDAENKKYGVGGSPTLVINGQKVQSGRDAQSLLNTVCGAFTSKPEECNTDMTSFGSPAPGFGFDTQGGSATSAGCGT